MSGSILAAILTPVVIMPILGGWLAVLFYVGNHPLWRSQTQSGARQLGESAQPELPGQPSGHA
jgi:hypothetical protein